MALCCHQKCQWNHFFGRELLQEMNFTPLDFHLISHMTSWAVCGRHPTQDDHAHSGYKPHPKEDIGLQCKHFLNTIRCQRLSQLGYETKLVQYVERETSLENVLLIAYH